MTIGTDPEFFVRTKDGKYINAEKMFPGTKEDPYIIESGAGILTDNVAVEFASPVAENGKDLVHKLKHTFHELFRMLPEDMVLDTSPSAIFDEDQLQTEQAQLFGCSPSYDAWELKVNDQPNAENTNMRSIGGHIHVGHKEGDNNDFLLDPYGKIDMVRVMDGIHGIISVVLDSSKEALERKKLYGKAGEHRPTPYGIEYRTLSTFWLKSPDLVMLISCLTEDALTIVREEKHKDFLKKLGEKEIVSIINTGDIKKANNIINNILPKYLSEESLHYLNNCMEKIDIYDFNNEWNTAEVTA